MSGFRAIGIWPLDRQATKHAMIPSEGYDHRDTTGVGAETEPGGHPEAPVTGLAGHPVLGGVTGCSDHRRGTDQRSSQAHVDAIDSTSTNDSECDESPSAMCTPTSPVHNATTPHAISTLTSLMSTTALMSQSGDTSQSIVIFNLIWNRNKREEILVRSLYYQRSYHQENGRGSNPYWISQNLRFSPPVHIVKAVNV